MVNWTQSFVLIMTLVLGGEYAKYNFAQDIGEIFPDRSGNGFDGANGTSHLDTNYNMQQQINRGLYNNASWSSYAVCPAETLTSQTISLNSSTANYSVAMFLNVGPYDASQQQFAQVMAICSHSGLFSGYTGWHDLQLGYGIDRWFISCALDASQEDQLRWGDLPKPTLTGWQFMTWVVWYDIDRPRFEWFINGVSYGVASSVTGGLVHIGPAPRFRFGMGFKGFISHAIIMTPGDSVMSNYFASGTLNCSPLSVCMIDPQKVIPGDCWDITLVSDCSVNWSWVSGTQWNFTIQDCDPCAACPSECSSCQFDYALFNYQCLILHSSLAISQDAGVYTCSWVESDNYFYADADQFPENYWLPCNSDCATCSGGTDEDWIICADGRFKQPAPVVTCQSTCPEYFYGDTTSKECTECHPSWRTCNGTAANLCTSCSDSNATITGIVSACACNDGQYDSDATGEVFCQQWNEDCLTCDGGTRDDCLVCAAGKFRQPTVNRPYSCESTCPDTFYADTTDNTWKACDSTWSTCTGPNAANCTSCEDQNASVTGTESACTCNSGWGDLVGTGLNCQPWNVHCNGWNAGQDHTSWIAWSAGFFLQPNGSATCDSTWQDGYVQNSVDRTWDPCHPSWSNCDGSTGANCLSWSVGYFWQPYNSNLCLDTCPERYFADSSDQRCRLCQEDCVTWLETMPDRCTTCTDSNTFVSVTGTCQWSYGFYVVGRYPLQWADSCPNGTVSYSFEWIETCPAWTYQESSECRQCHLDCDSCSGGLRSDWLECSHQNKQITEGECLCISGFYADPGDATNCIGCVTDCLTCSDGTTCQTCKALHAIPLNGICECTYPFLASNDISAPLEWLGCPKTSSYNNITAICELEWKSGEFPHDFEWKLCSENCTLWHNDSHCGRCSDGYYVNNQFICASWNQICTTCQEYDTNCTSCRDNFVLIGNTWTCPEPQTMQNTTWIDPIRVSIEANDNNVVTLHFSENLKQILTRDDLQTTIYTQNGKPIEFTYTLEKLKDDQYEISITPTTDNISEDSIFSMEFSEDYKSQEPISPIDFNLNTALHEQDSEQTEDEQKRQQEVSDSTSTGSMAILSASAFFASISYNFGALWRIINYLQLISLFAFFNMNTTPELDGFLSSCLKDSSIPNLYDFILPEDYDTLSLPIRFQKSNYEYPLLLDTFGHSMTIWLAISVVLVLAWKAANSNIGCLSKIGNKVQDSLVYNGLIRTVLETSIYIFIGSFLTFKFGFAYEIHSLINTSLSGLAMLLLFAFSVKCFTAIQTKNGQLGDEQKKYKDLTKDLQENTNNFSAYFNVIFLLRRAAFCSVVVFIEGPQVQILISAFLNISHLVWLICAWPFESMIINYIEIYSELIIVMTNLFMLIFLTEYEEINTISSVIIVLIITAIFSYFLLIIRSIFVKRCKRGSKIADENTEENETEGNINSDHSTAYITDFSSQNHSIAQDNKLDLPKIANKRDMNEDQQRLPRKTFAF